MILFEGLHYNFQRFSVDLKNVYLSNYFLKIKNDFEMKNKLLTKKSQFCKKKMLIKFGDFNPLTTSVPYHVDTIKLMGNIGC